MTPKFVMTYPVAIVASVLVVCFAAVTVVAILKGQDIQTVLGALGVFLASAGGVLAHRSTTPLANPRDANGRPLTPNE